MAFSATMSTSEPRAYSIGPEKVQRFTWTCLASDTSGTITLDRLSSVRQVTLNGGISLTAATTYATNVATLTFTSNTPVTYTGSCASAAATVGAVYADSEGNAFTIGATIAGATSVTVKGTKPPVGATLTKIAGTGDATIGTFAITTAPTLYGEGLAYGV